MRIYIVAYSIVEVLLVSPEKLGQLQDETAHDETEQRRDIACVVAKYSTCEKEPENTQPSLASILPTEKSCSRYNS